MTEVQRVARVQEIKDKCLSAHRAIIMLGDKGFNGMSEEQFDVSDRELRDHWDVC